MSNYGKYPYVTLADVQNYLTISSNTSDARLSNLISYACAAVEHYIGYEILSNSYVEVFDGGYTSIFTSRLPIQEIHTLEEYNGSNYVKLNSPKPDGSSINRNTTNYTIINNNSLLKSRYKKYGSSSCFFNGINSYLSIANSDDWYFSDSNFTIDFHIRANSYSSDMTFISHVTDINNYWSLSYNTINGFNFIAVDGGVETINVSHTSNSGYSANTYHHVEVTRNGNNFNLFRDGIILSNSISTYVMPDINSSLEIGRQNLVSNYNYFNGFMDELRISHIARHTANFSVATYQYSIDDDTKLLLHFDGENNSNEISDIHATVEDFLFYPETGEITKNIGSGAGNYDISVGGATNFNNYPRGIRVTYKAGYDLDNVPNDLILSTLDYIKMLHKERQESQSFSFQGENVQDRQLSANFPPHIKRILDLYRVII